MKTVSATEAKNRLGAYVESVLRGEGGILIENHGKPAAVLVSYGEYRALREAMEDIWRLREEVLARNRDLTEEEADAIAQDVGREAILNVVARAKGQRMERAG